MDSEATSRSWEIFKMPDKRYFFKMIFRNSGPDQGYEVSWTDMMSVWTESLNEEEIKERTQTLNPGIEVPVDTLLTHLEANTSPEQCSVTEVPGEGLMVELNMDLSGIPFEWRFQCTQMPQQQLLESFIQPLMIMTAELHRRQAVLVDLLQKKDIEIEDYRTVQGFSTTRKRIKTKLFDEKEFTDLMLKSKEFDSVIRSGHDLAFDDHNRSLFDCIMKRKQELQSGEDLQNVNDNVDGPIDVSTATLSSPQQHASPQKSDDNLLTEEEERERREALNRRLAEKRHIKVENDKKKKKKKAL